MALVKERERHWKVSIPVLCRCGVFASMRVRIAYPGSNQTSQEKERSNWSCGQYGTWLSSEALTCRSRKVVPGRMSVIGQSMWRGLLSSYQSLKKDLKSVYFGYRLDYYQDCNHPVVALVMKRFSHSPIVFERRLLPCWWYRYLQWDSTPITLVGLNSHSTALQYRSIPIMPKQTQLNGYVSN